MRGWFALLMIGLALAPAQGSDLEREARLAAEIEGSIVVGEPLYLTADGHDFLALYTLAEPARGSTLILHGRGYQPDWPLVAGPLREGLDDPVHPTPGPDQGRQLLRLCAHFPGGHSKNTSCADAPARRGG